jgi:hypothetical protein
MPSDQTVTARDVLRALADVRRRGTRSALAEFEQLEPDLAEFLIEEVTAIHHDVAATGARARRLRALTERVETLVIVLVQSLRQAHLRLWGETPANPATDAAGTPGTPGDNGSTDRQDTVDGPEAPGGTN